MNVKLYSSNHKNRNIIRSLCSPENIRIFLISYTTIQNKNVKINKIMKNIKYKIKIKKVLLGNTHTVTSILSNAVFKNKSSGIIKSWVLRLWYTTIYMCRPNRHNKGQKWYGPKQKQKILRRGGNDTQKNYTKKISMAQITTMVWFLT